MTVEVDRYAPSAWKTEKLACEIAGWEHGPGREKAIAALFHDTAHLLVCRRETEVIGVASFRIVDDFIKRINTGVKYPRMGTGSVLVAEMILWYPQRPMFTKSIPDAWGFCEAIGMKHAMDFGDKLNRRLYLWSAKECEAFLMQKPA